MHSTRSWRAILPWAPYLLVSAWHLYGTLPNVSGIAGPTKGLLMPLLLITFLQIVKEPTKGLAPFVAAALLLSWLGDITLSNFVVGLVFFLLAQLTYAYVFGRGPGKIKWPAAAIFAFCAALLVWLVPHAGSMAGPVVVYALAISVMAFLASRVNTIAFVGALLFVLSDSVIAVDRFITSVSVPSPDLLIMLTYLVGQGLIILGVSRWLKRAE